MSHPASPSPPESDYDSSSSSSSSSSPSSPSQLFTRFPDLPPEIRHQIWLAAVPSPGINFFNVHVIPNDHPGANRSTSPPLARLDLRRLDITHDDDRHVARYDPSAWWVRHTLCRTCREARAVCSIPEGKAAAITLTRPRRGLFVRAGDGQLRRLTPLRDLRGDLRRGDSDGDGDGDDNSNGGKPELAAASTSTSDNPSVTTISQPGEQVQDNDQDQLVLRQHRPNSGPRQSPRHRDVEQLAHRIIRVHTDDMLCLSIENCSFNLPYEESPFLRGADDGVDGLATVAGRGESDDEDEDDDDADMGWVYDPQFHPPLPPSIPQDRYCVNMARGSKAALRAVQDVTAGLILAPSLSGGAQHLVMFDAVTQAIGKRPLAELTPAAEVFWDRFGDCYVPLPWDPKDLRARYRLTKMWPETNDVRVRYLRSSLLRSPKRLSRFPYGRGV